MIILGLFILNTVVWFAAGAAFGYRKGFVKGTKSTAAKLVSTMNEEMDRNLYKLIKQATDDVNDRWGKFLGFSDTEIKKAKETATKDYERKLH